MTSMQPQFSPSPHVRQNVSESALPGLAASLGWTYTKRGWPDFVCFTPEGEMIAVEVKPQLKGKPGLKLLKREQDIVMRKLTEAGIRCFVSDGHTLEPFDPAIHAQESRRYSRNRQP